MSFSNQFQFLILLLSYFLSSAQPNNFQHYFCFDTNGNYTSNSTFSTNLNTLLSTLISNTTTSSFYNLTTGKNAGVDQANAVALCRADVSQSYCNSCLSDAARKIRAVCPTQREAIIWYDNCMIHYSPKSIFRAMQATPQFAVSSMDATQDTASYDTFVVQRDTLLRELRDAASAGDFRRKYAYGFAVINNKANVYAQVECTPDLTKTECWDCVQGAIGYDIRYDGIKTYNAGCCNGFEQAMIGRPSCMIRYNALKLYNVLEDQSPIIVPLNGTGTSGTTTPTFDKSKKSPNTSVIAIAIVGATAIIIVMIIISILWNKKKSRNPRADFQKDEIGTLEPLHFNFGVIELATKGFSSDNKLGQGGYGVVYKGQLPNGQEVAVKRLLRKTKQGDAQFKNEILTLAKLDHRNLVRLIGFCLENEEILLIYELLAKGSLDRLIFDPVQNAFMPWDARYKIINGIARGLLYLHHDSKLRIIHRDLKAGNVLLDASFNPKIADFGMARLFNIDHTQSKASKIAGTYGYMAPEYVLHGYVSMKSDVYSFGVLVLEIISGQRIGFFQHGESSEGLLIYAWKSWMGGTPWKFVDPTLLSNGITAEILECAHVGLLCVQHNPADRPTMSLVALMLNSYSQSLPVPSPPGFFSPGNIQPVNPKSERTSDESSNKLARNSVNEMSITQIYPR